jgi:short-subunit dehydrogenase
LEGKRGVTGVSKTVLVTGASLRIGAATAHRAETRTELAAAGCATAQLELVDTAALKSETAEIARFHGTVGVLINNPGFRQSRALEAFMRTIFPQPGG